jgi:hypothetical protein
MFSADLVPSPENAPFKEGKGVLNGISMDFSIYISPATMLDSLVTVRGNGSLLYGKGIRTQIIGDYNRKVLVNVVLDIAGEGAGLHIRGVKKAKLSTALPESNDDLLVLGAAAPFPTLHLAADIGFVYLNGPLQHWFEGATHCCPNPMTKIPGCLVTNPENPFHLVSGKPFTGFADQINCYKPFKDR